MFATSQNAFLTTEKMGSEVSKRAFVEMVEQLQRYCVEDGALALSEAQWTIRAIERPHTNRELDSSSFSRTGQHRPAPTTTDH
jgi:hypothetical protein